MNAGSLRTAAAAAFLSSSLFLSAGCSRPLPEAEGSEAKFYEARCAGCHRTYHPSVLTATMWKYQVDRMDGKYREARMPVPTAQEKERILAYLLRFAGG